LFKHAVARSAHVLRLDAVEKCALLFVSYGPSCDRCWFYRSSDVLNNVIALARTAPRGCQYGGLLSSKWHMDYRRVSSNAKPATATLATKT
jgi:hypothetical protein